MKMLGIAAIAALGLALGAGSASATTLCTDSACGVVYPAGTSFGLSLKSGTTMSYTFELTETSATCTGLGIAGATQNSSGASIVVGLSGMSFTGCSQTTDTISAGSLEITRTSANSGSVTGKGNQVTMQVLGASCTYGDGGGTPLGTLSGGTAPVLSINGAVLAKTAGGFFCPSTAAWDAEFIVTAPHALYIG